MGAVQRMCGEGERRPWWCSVPCSCSGFRRVPGQSGGKLRWPSQLLSLFSAGLFCLTYCSWVPWVPCRDTIHQNILHHTTIEGPEDAEGEKGLFQLPQEVQSLRGRFVIPEVFLFQLMSCEICTPRNLMFSTLCTVRPLILTGACFGCDLWKSINIHIEHRFSSLPQPSRCLTSSLYIVFSVHPLCHICRTRGIWCVKKGRKVDWTHYFSGFYTGFGIEKW